MQKRHYLLAAGIYVVVLAYSATSSAQGFTNVGVGEPAPAPAPSYSYAPQYYQTYQVFYDSEGRPIYYENDVAYSVPTNAPGYNALVSHYRRHAGAYHHWFDTVGHTRLSYRRPVAASYYSPQYYYEYPVFYDGTGRPTYYLNGTRHYVPASYYLYSSLVSHYRHKRGAYRRWYNARGRYLRGYRRALRTNSSYYKPQYYDGYVVYYDDGGLPFYYMGGRVVHIPSSYHRYGFYRDHYRRHHRNYRRWHRSEGKRFRHYRRHKRAHHKRVINRHAPAARRGRAVNRHYYRRNAPAGVRHRARHAAPPARRYGASPGRRNHRARPVRSASPRRVAPVNRAVRRGGVNCSRNPGHPSCRRSSQGTRGRRSNSGVRRGTPRGQRSHKRSQGNRRRARHNN